MQKNSLIAPREGVLKSSWCSFDRLKEKGALQLILGDEISVEEMDILMWFHMIKRSTDRIKIQDIDVARHRLFSKEFYCFYLFIFVVLRF